MNIPDIQNRLETSDIGTDMYGLATELFPFCRSLTGDGVRRTLDAIQRLIPLEIVETPSGESIFDWTVPPEWNIRGAYIEASDGRRIVDFADSNLHVVGYSEPVDQNLSLEQLREHLFTLPDHPDWIPYRTSYHKRTWGFCMRHRDLESLAPGTYRVVIDSTLAPGQLTYGEHRLTGETDDEVLISCHICHPSLANDNLSGISVAAAWARWLGTMPRRYTYRFLFIPATVGSLTWLSRHRARAERVKHGLVLACVGDAGRFTYKKSRRGDAEIDRILQYVLPPDASIRGFSPYGYDERQYCSPGFNLPVGCLMRTPHGEYPEYHTSADDLAFISAAQLAGTLELCTEVSDILERNLAYVNQSPYGEPQLGKRGLYDTMGGSQHGKTLQLAILWVLNMSDGTHTLLDITNQSGLPFEVVAEAAEKLREAELLVPVAAGTQIETTGAES